MAMNRFEWTAARTVAEAAAAAAPPSPMPCCADAGRRPWC